MKENFSIAGGRILTLMNEPEMPRGIKRLRKAMILLSTMCHSVIRKKTSTA